ncbi:MAG: ester cyclase [Planctomycetota bacterium]
MTGTPEQNVAVSKLISALNDPNHAMDKIAGLFDDGFMNGNPMAGEKGDKAGTVDTFRQLLIAFPDLNYNVDGISGDGDKVTVKLSITGTNTGDWMGHAATNKKISINVVDVAKVMKGKFTECSSLYDVPAIEKQLGMGGN